MRRASSRLGRPGAYNGRLTAVLGPTNTGKTHLAVTRMLGHSSGMIGLPLRLLAREVYDRVVALRGPRSVALITGEEKIVPPNPSYFVSTVEAMPLERDVAFVAIDEIQLCGDLERGHVFTDRLLRARGREETMFLGAATIRRVLRRLLPDAEFTTRPRFSKLTHSGSTKLSRLPRRTAIVAFSANEVYAIAEQIRRQKGGAAVVMGALSPRTRNAQVALYQHGDVDYLVATDAIGMGLNMDVDHVAFASLEKFDGISHRRLRVAEIAQIAGRAGRHMNDGTFGTVSGGDRDPGLRLDALSIECIEQHRFPSLRFLMWRNTMLDFRSLDALIRSLGEPVPLDVLARAPLAEDLRVLKTLAGDPAIAALARAPAACARLWEACQIPDFRKTMAEVHARLVGRIYRHLMSGDGNLPTDWLARQMSRLDRADGDIDTLAARIAHIRTWTYVANRPDWVDDPEHWRGRARAIEDKLSDALHDRLIQRFVDQRATVLMRRLGEDSQLFAVVGSDGDVAVESQFIGQLKGLRFEPDPGAAPAEVRMLVGAAMRSLRREIAARTGKLAAAPDRDIELRHGESLGRATIWWRGGALARLTPGADILSPRIEILRNDLLEGTNRERVRARLQRWLDCHIALTVGPLAALRNALEQGKDRSPGSAGLVGAARGLAFQIAENLGSVRRRDVRNLMAALTPGDRSGLRRLGIRFGEATIYMPALIKPAAAETRRLLWAVKAGIKDIPAPPIGRRVSLAVEPGIPPAVYEVAGFRVIGERAIRIDRLERLARTARRLGRAGPFAATADLAALVGCGNCSIAVILGELGYRGEQSGEITVFVRRGRKGNRAGQRRRKGRGKGTRPIVGQGRDSPFAELASMIKARPRA